MEIAVIDCKISDYSRFMSYDILKIFIFMFVDKDITDREAEQACFCIFDL